MNLPLFRPSVTLTVPQNTSVVECLRLMRNRGVGSVLVVDAKDSSSLQGIFTERDLLRNYDVLREKDRDLDPISRYMTREMITLPVSQMQGAAQLMMERHIRHVILTFDDEEGTKGKLAGVLSIRDVLAQLLKQNEGKLPPTLKIPSNILVISDSDDTRKLLRALFWKQKTVNFKVLDSFAKNATEEAQGTECLFLDLDYYASKTWAELLKQVIRPDSKKKIVVLYNPLGMRSHELVVLERLAQSHHIHILEKPMSVQDVYDALDTRDA